MTSRHVAGSRCYTFGGISKDARALIEYNATSVYDDGVIRGCNRFGNDNKRIGGKQCVCIPVALRGFRIAFA